MRGGQLYSIPYKTASSSTRTYPTALAFGSHDPILNRSTDKRSEAGSKFSATAVTSAGATKKPLSPYVRAAGRKRVDGSGGLEEARRLLTPSPRPLSLDRRRSPRRRGTG